MVSRQSFLSIWQRSALFLRAAAATIPVLVVTGYLFLEGRNSERLLLDAETEHQADNAMFQFQSYISARVDTLRSAGNFVLSNKRDATLDDFPIFAGRMLSDLPDLETVAWRNTDGSVWSRVPNTSAARDIAHIWATSVPETLAKAAKSHQPTATGSFALRDSQQGVALVVPIVRDNQMEGAITGVLRLTDGIHGLYGRDVLDFCSLQIEDRTGRVVYNSLGAAPGAQPPPTASLRHVPVADRAWKLRLWPTPLLVSSLRTAAPERILIIGLLAGVVIAVANYLLAQRQMKLGESLRESERLTADVERTRQRLADLVNGIDAVIWESGADVQRYTFVNDYARKLLGLDTQRWLAVPEFWFEHVHPDDLARARENSAAAQRPGQTYPAEYRMIDSAGKVIWVREIITVIGNAGRVVGRRGVVVDISARVQAEEAVRQSQKLESLGVLAGGIAHDFNNLLTTILGNAEMLAPYLSGDANPGRLYLDKMERTTRRLAELTRQMLAYSGRGQFTVNEVDLNAIITEMAGLLTVSTPKNVQVIYKLDPSLPIMAADAAQIRQVVLNLLTNAAEAIGEHRRGEVIIKTDTCVLDARQATELFAEQDLEPGRYVRLEVSDTGCGMSAETLSKIFDPFFTTKFTGRGLGLAALRGIVRGHRGGIRIFSRLGEGTVFTLLFPAVGEHAAGKRLEISGRSGFARLEHASVLIVDDEDELRSLMSMALEEAGCIVFQATDGEEGVEQFRLHASEIDIVILDLTMPKLSGDEVFRQIKAMDADVCVILSSGYTQEDVTRQFAGQGLAGFIEKPFTPSELIEKIRIVLAEGCKRTAFPAMAVPSKSDELHEALKNGRNPSRDGS